MGKTHFVDDDQSLSASSDDSNAAVNLHEYVEQSVHVSITTTGSAQKYRRSQLEQRSNTEETLKNAPLFFSMFKISFILLTVSIISLIGIFFFYPNQLGISSGTADQSNDGMPLVTFLLGTSNPSLSPTENSYVYQSIIPTARPISVSVETGMPTTITKPIYNPHHETTVTSAPTSKPTLSPIAPPTFTPTSKQTTFPTRTPTLNPTSEPTRTSITFYVLGDIPYDIDEEIILSEQILNIPNDAEFIFHVGDIMRPKRTYCVDSAYGRVKQILLQSKVPVFITLGDNDWIDCPDRNIALSYWHKNFHQFDLNWRHSLPVIRHSKRSENLAWLQEKVLFISVHIVGGSIYDADEWSTRLNDDIEWLNYNINRYKHHAKAIVLFGHAKPNNNLSYFFESLATISNNLGMPMLYVHGDGHKYYLRRVPFYNAYHIVEVQVDQGKNAPPLKVTVNNDATSPYDVFEFDRRLSDS